MKLGKYSIGIGDRFTCQGKALLEAAIKAKEKGVDIIPIWNKSHREHTIINTQPIDTRREADSAVKACNWQDAYFVDADHVGLKTVDLFLESSDFFTLDVADFIERQAEEKDVQRFIDKYQKYLGTLVIPEIEASFEISEKMIAEMARRYLYAVQQAGRIYQHILAQKGEGNFVVEVSMDETRHPQTPIELFFILAAIANEGIPAQTIAPKFTGRFNKGIDYVGDIHQFTKEFEQDIAVINFAIKEFSLPSNLKLSVHSGSDKFSIYGPIRRALSKFDAGLHLKTAGTTWLEELIGLAMAGADGLAIAQEIYRKAYARFDELCQPYASVIDIDRDRLPAPDQVDRWDCELFAASLRHDPSNTHYNLHFRQLLHVGYKIAAEMGARYLNALNKHTDVIAKNVIENMYERHIRPIFIGE